MQASRSLVSCGPSACTARLGCRVAVQPGGAQPLIASSAQRAAALRRLTVVRAEGEEASNSEEEEPIWVRREKEREMNKDGGGAGLPFGVYLLLSSFVAIAAVGSIYEFANKNPIFGVIEADSPLYTPILGLFMVTGFPTAAFLFIKSVTAANAESERMDKLDGY